ncbi:MAG TPA: PKD domain-containing protein, partial [Ferruginibacter sp.]|nr:PKD domain-containing protein [Ferruginibacter sp.]
FNALGTLTGNSGVDLTGSKIVSIASGTGNCKPIAVFSGSGKINLNCPVNAGGSADNYIVQSFPKTAWGKNYLTVPTAGMPYNYFRIAVSDPTAVVKLNGVTMSGLINNFYYQIAATNQPNYIQSDKPIMVAQYITTSGACGNNVGIPSGEGDPEVMYLSSIEQNIQRVLVNSTPHYAINEHFISVLVPNGGTGVSSFRLDGAVPSTPFVVHPQNSNYSYLQQAVTVGTHVLQSDSGFNAQAYGYGNVESYGYNAGTNIKDLFTFITPINPLNISTNVTACTGTPFYFSVTLPKPPDSLTYLAWDFHNNPPGSPYPNVTQYAPLTADATYFIGSTQVWRYKLPSLYTYAPAGIYPVTITAGTVTSEGCGNSVIIDRDLYVYDPPVLSFRADNNGCVTDSVAFTDTTTYAPGTYPYQWWWDFGDGTFSSIKSPKHLYVTAGTYTVRYASVTNVGCLSDTATRTVTITNVPVPKFGVSSPVCDGFPVTFSDSSTLTPPGTLVKWYWDYGDGLKDTLATGIDRVHTYSPWGNKIVKLKVETNSGCQSNFADTIYVGPIPWVNFTMPAAVCLPADSAHFMDLSNIADGTESGFGYKWHFGEPSSGINDSSILRNPGHRYSSVGPFNVNLRVTSNVGCRHDTTKVFMNVFAQAHADFTVNPENCLRDSSSFTSNATGSGSTIVEWHWDFGDGGFSTLQNPKHLYATTGIKTIKHWVVTDKGCYSDTTTHTIVINPLPTAGFTYSAPSCNTKTISFTDASVANAGTLDDWQWNFGDPSSGANNMSSLQNPTHIFANWGTFQVKLVARSTKGCYSDTFTLGVVINPQPKPGFISPEVCLSDAFAQFIDTSSVATGTIVSWFWNFGDPSSGPLNTSTLQNPQHRYNAIGFYTATLTVTSSSGCIDSVAQTFTVNGDIPVSNFNALNPANLCANDSVAIQDASTVNFGNITKIDIWWDNVGAPLTVQTENNPYPGIIIKHLYPNFQTPPTKTYDIKWRAYSGATCLSDKIKTIVVNAAPKVQFNPVPPICYDAAPYQITQASEVGGVPGTFVFSGTGVSPTGLFNPTVAGSGLHTILYTYTSNTGGCVDTASQTILVWDPPVAGFMFSAPHCENVPITFTDTSTNTFGSITTWTWDFGDGTPVQVRNNNTPFTHTFVNWGVYNVKLKVTTSNGCNSAVKTIPVDVRPQPKPNFSIPASVCLPDAVVTFINTSTIADGTENAFTYLWHLGDPPSGAADSSTV